MIQLGSSMGRCSFPTIAQFGASVASGVLSAVGRGVGFGLFSPLPQLSRVIPAAAPASDLSKVRRLSR